MIVLGIFFKAEPDTDEVFAQIILLPEQQVSSLFDGCAITRMKNHLFVGLKLKQFAIFFSFGMPAR